MIWKLFSYGILRKKDLIEDLSNHFKVSIKIDATSVSGIKIYNDEIINFAVITKGAKSVNGMLLTFIGTDKSIEDLKNYLDVLESGYKRLPVEDDYLEIVDAYIWQGKTRGKIEGMLDYEEMMF